MSDTIDNFKNFYKQDQEKSDFRIRDAYEKMVAMVGHNLKHNNISISYSSDSDIKIFGNQNEFSQVLLNLIINARDALLSNQTSKPRIWIMASYEDNTAKLSISDNAGGIKGDLLEKIFEPYFSTKKEHGTGIGLYMVRSIIQEKFRGKVDVINGDEGATFRIEIPINIKS